MATNELQDRRIEQLELALDHERRLRVAREDREARGRAWLRRTMLAASSAVFLAGLIGFVRVAYAANCQQTLPAPLVTFCAGDPALAKDINGNFQGVANQLIAKVGAWGSVDATMNAVTMKSATVTGGVTVGGDLKVTGKALVGYHVVKCIQNQGCTCPGGEVLLGGGASCPNGNGSALNYSSINPFNPAAWTAYCTLNMPDIAIMCARLAL